jgi:chromosome segregation ATPase
MKLVMNLAFWIVSVLFLAVVVLLWLNLKHISDTAEQQRRDIQQQATRIASQQQIVDKLNDDLAGSQAKLSAAQRQVDNANSQLAAMLIQLTDANAELARLKSERQSLSAQNAQTRADLQNLTAQKTSLQTTINAVSAQKNKLCADVRSLRDRFMQIHVEDEQSKQILAQKWADCGF